MAYSSNLPVWTNPAGFFGQSYGAMGSGHKAYFEYQSCRLGRRKQSGRMAGGRVCGGRLVDPDLQFRAAYFQYYQQLIQGQYHQLSGLAGLSAAQNVPSTGNGLIGGIIGQYIPLQEVKSPSFWSRIKNFLA